MKLVLVQLMLTGDLYVHIIMCCSILIYAQKYGRPSPFQTPSDFPAKQIELILLPYFLLFLRKTINMHGFA